MFKQLATRNLGLIRYIWYTIELQDYDWTESNLLPTIELLETNHFIMEDGIRTMFCALSECPPAGNMTLDISIHSPSDSQHHFKYIRFEPASMLNSRHPLKSVLQYNSAHISSVQLPPTTAVDRVFFPEISFLECENNFWTTVPRVPCVFHLLLRRQTRHRWDPDALGRLMTCLPNLQDIFFETWREWQRCDQNHKDMRKCPFTAGSTCN
jgi:hypothetical protein